MSRLKKVLVKSSYSVLMNGSYSERLSVTIGFFSAFRFLVGVRKVICLDKLKVGGGSSLACSPSLRKFALSPSFRQRVTLEVTDSASRKKLTSIGEVTY